jgi:4-amino-4-deoxy-L-arabinose transferase-like glycosyltransferase
VSTPEPLFPKATARLFLLLALLWAAIYLPGLGALELKGEEGRRILPGLTMLETGDWIVPYVGGKPFLRKPPLVNWLIASSFKVTGVVSEFTARLPTTLALGALALTVLALGTGRDWMNTDTALLAAVFVITPTAALDKGRLAEIDGIYLALGGGATVLWLAFWTQRRSPWLLWLVPFAFLGVGLLAKAPLHLLFFYAVVCAVLGYAREWRLLLHPAHFLGIALAGGIFAAWAVPYFQNEATKQAAEVWQAQSLGRLSGKTDWAGWALNIPRALVDQLPWVLFAPLLWRAELPALGQRAYSMFRGARVGIALCFFGMLLLPGILPRYVLPLLPPFACLLALAVGDPRLTPPSGTLRAWWRVNSGVALVIAVLACASPVVLAIADRKHLLGLRADYPSAAAAAFSLYVSWSLVAAGGALLLSLVVWLGRYKLARPSLLGLASAALVAAIMFLFAGAGVPFLVRKDKLRPMATMVRETVPAGTPICVYDPDYMPALFYLPKPYFYATVMEEIPAGAPWVLTREEKRKKLLRDRPEFAVAHEFPGTNPPSILLKQRGAAQ